MKSQEIRQKFLEYYKSKNHEVIPSASIVPEGDSTTLFTGSGMQPLVPYLLGQKHPKGNRLVNSQKSFRGEDIEEVGDNRHTTFFEMLGNWSLGDYFKKEQLPWFFKFLTEEIGLDASRLYVTVFEGDAKNGIPKDEESIAIWKELFRSKGIDAKVVELGTEEAGYEEGMQGGRIFAYGKKNWWSRAGSPEKMPVGEPGGPDSEVFYDFGLEHDPKFGANCHPNCDCGRFLEIGNSVFMEYVKTEGGFEKLAQHNVDFGGGFERIAAASIGSPDVFKIDLFQPALERIRSLGASPDTFSERIIADHLRASVFLVADGVIPSNKDRGYILRRLIRRAVTYGKKMGIEKDFVADVAQVYIDTYKSTYPETANSRIVEELAKEEKKFRQTLVKGLKHLEKLGSITGKEAFDLFQTYGFPFELTMELAKVKDPESFKEEFAKHQELSRTASAGQFKGGLASHSEKIVKLHTATHLMNAALRKVLGNDVWQKGSNITEERTRFDFTYNAKLSDEQKQEVERLVNTWIEQDLAVKKENMSQEEAKNLGAIGVFGEKYPDQVSIYSVYDPQTGEVISREFCGGPHVEHTGVIGAFKIQKEEAVSAGVRRIKAVIS